MIFQQFLHLPIVHAVWDGDDPVAHVVVDAPAVHNRRVALHAVPTVGVGVDVLVLVV